ncbi:hypothetical protein [Calidithermus chliarophilus]|uniref:hypothetical protein n=1 Tax=Calidithermus chliarophilus TaxID=52023 RepID=UPI000418CC27|nr:hypothetical protein [Calidithermus chliarophilus]
MNPILVISAGSSFILALLHVWIAWKGAPAYRFFGAGEGMARSAERGSPAPAALTLGLALVFTAFGCYALAGAGAIPPLPLQVPVLWGIGSVYALRGLAVFAELVMIRQGRAVLPQNPWFSLVALLIGIFHLWGSSLGGVK